MYYIYNNNLQILDLHPKKSGNYYCFYPDDISAEMLPSEPKDRALSYVKQHVIITEDSYIVIEGDLIYHIFITRKTIIIILITIVMKSTLVKQEDC